MPEYYIGIDLGGTLIRAARFDSDLNILDRSETETLDEEGKDAVIRRMVEQAQAVWPHDGGRVAAVGISAPGGLNPVTGIVTKPPNLQGWHKVPLRDLFQGLIGVQTYIGNDANLAALAETTMGASRGYRDVVFLTISTGIGSGIISDGKLLIGSEGLGAECGHMIMIVDGNVSTLEKEAAGPSIARQARSALEAGEKSAISEMVNGVLDDISGRTVGEAARAGDPLARRLIERAGRIVGLGIVSLLHVFNPEIVVLGGGVTKGTGELLLKPMRTAIEQYALDPAYWEKLVIAPAQLGDNVSLIGAGALAVQGGT
jgi:glucokinase